MTEPEIHVIPTLTHGRVLVRGARTARSRGVIVGFHGYMENAATQLQRLEALSGSSAWTLVAIQGLHRFYRGRTQEVVASWMTREDRESAIADNIAYVAAALEAVPHDASAPIVYAGFSQGVAMAFRSAARGPGRAASVIAVGGDVPPELIADRSTRLPPVLVVRGRQDEWYTQAKFAADIASLVDRGVPVESWLHDGAHDWTPAVTAAIGEFLERGTVPFFRGGQSPFPAKSPGTG